MSLSEIAKIIEKCLQTLEKYGFGLQYYDYRFDVITLVDGGVQLTFMVTHHNGFSMDEVEKLIAVAKELGVSRDDVFFSGDEDETRFIMRFILGREKRE